ncbi:transcriptional regulator [Romboutsia ilealis]|uniref:Transcriptional regulator n=1 Tax=Romboutsia faecis TaxID=2764597 RepID=A0ABR7JRX1_9FIRM|nr:transcriptional regulator [Romboutsia faecis]MBC5997665.1 transcriptional regulator [Romboutsia faecis]MRN25386.1 transcriptional regulator [Romboutsia ilealis]
MKRLDKELVTREKVFTEIKGYIDEFGISPTVRELVKLVGVKSPATIQRHIDGLVESGKIIRESNKPRTIRIGRI